MIKKRLPLEYSIEKNFPDAKLIHHPVDKKVIKNLLHIIEYENEEELKKYLDEKLSWAVNTEGW